MIEIIPNWHPLFVHFTVALLSVSLGLFVISRLVKCDQAVLVAKWNLWIGSAITLITVAAGFYAYNTVAHDTPSHEAMTEHRNLALITIALLLPVLAWSVIAHRKGKSLGLAFVGLFVLQGALLASTAWHGGELVYRHGLGVMSLPKTDSHDHAGHSHGGSGHDDDGHADEHGHEHEDQHKRGHDSSDMMDGEAGEMNMEGMGIDEMSMDAMPEDDDHHHDDDGHDHEH